MYIYCDMIDGSTTTVNLFREQVEYIRKQGKEFNFSAFVRMKFDEYIKMVEIKDGE